MWETENEKKKPYIFKSSVYISRLVDLYNYFKKRAKFFIHLIWAKASIIFNQSEANPAYIF